MADLKIRFVDLAPSSRLNRAQDLRALFETVDCPYHLDDSRPAEEPYCSADQQTADAIVVILPETITEKERTVIRTLSSRSQALPIMAIIEEAATREVMELFKLGVTDFITPPIKASEVLPRLWRLTEHVQKKNNLIERLKEKVGLRQIIGNSVALTAELRKIPFVAGCDSSVLISGETGTGKEMIARAIHYLGPRAGKPFCPVNCGAIPTELVENELFGHARGAFTGAASTENGIVQECDGGTLFLDEIDCLPLSAQVKLLRFLQEKEYRQLGSARTRHADVRIIAATNCDPELAVKKGTFRRDLYYRLNVVPLSLPSLRERREDIMLLIRHFVEQYATEFNKRIDAISVEAERKLLLYDWPGNVRELQNIVERAVVFSSGAVLEKEDFHLPGSTATWCAKSFQEAKAKIVGEFEKDYINTLLIAHRGNITQAALTAGKNRRAFWELMKKHDISSSQFRPSP